MIVKEYCLIFFMMVLWRLSLLAFFLILLVYLLLPFFFFQRHWQYLVQWSGVQQSSICCNGSKNAAPQLDVVASTRSSCVELSVHHLFLWITPTLGFNHEMYHAFYDAHSDSYKEKFPKRILGKHVLPFSCCFQGHPDCGNMWIQWINFIPNTIASSFCKLLQGLYQT